MTLNEFLTVDTLTEDEIDEVECFSKDTDIDNKESSQDVTFQVPVQSGSAHHNYPMLCDIFKDPETQFEKVILAVCLPGGISNVTMEISDDGLTVEIKYNWPDCLFDMQDLFKKQLSSKKIYIHHPMVTCLKSSLENVRTRIDAAPEASAVITLPIKVQSTPESWVKWGIMRENGTQVIVATFTGYIKNYNKKISDSTVTFEM